MEYFDGDLVAGLKKPAKVCRATRLTKEQWDEVLSHYQPDPFHDFLVVMTETGCRPQEMRVTVARRLHLAAMMVRFEDGGMPSKKYGRNVEVVKLATPLRTRALNSCFQAEAEMAPLPVHNWLVGVADTTSTP
jgi:hypothetical protein